MDGHIEANGSMASTSANTPVRGINFEPRLTRTTSSNASSSGALLSPAHKSPRIAFQGIENKGAAACLQLIWANQCPPTLVPSSRRASGDVSRMEADFWLASTGPNIRVGCHFVQVTAPSSLFCAALPTPLVRVVSARG